MLILLICKIRNKFSLSVLENFILVSSGTSSSVSVHGVIALFLLESVTSPVKCC